jgi:hypothetical protein
VPALPAPADHTAAPTGTPAPAATTPPTTPRRVGAPRGARTAKPRARSRRRAAPPDVDGLMPLGWQIAADLDQQGTPLTRDTLAAALRERGQSAGNARVGALLARLKTDTPPRHDTTTGTDAPSHNDEADHETGHETDDEGGRRA